ncbi:MAG TPA: SRPBCC domain-containing protein [Candidatus Limnocylindrales bacterium]|jgi:uncharacterized protein YndB with AHSA1/START domain|nr:SRPBCC domain-containing protein [Candidatus Limnocylindrales bacterium]
MDAPTTITEGSIERELRIQARPETVFDFWTDPVKMARWMGRDVRLDPRPGGELRIDYNGSDIARGAFVEVDRPNRIVITWGWEAAGNATPPGASTVEVTFTADGDGTILRFRHSGLAPEVVESHAQGWDQFLPSLVEVAAAG